MTLRFSAGGGAPPESHEELTVEPGGGGWYLTGMPWPAQRPFDEIGAYRVSGADHDALARLAQSAIDGPEPEAGHADAGVEAVELDGARASWGPRQRTAEAQAFVDAARAVITAARREPVAVAQAAIDGDLVRVVNRGDVPLEVRNGELRAGDSARPMTLAHAEPAAVELPRELAPGAAVELPLRDADATHALVFLRWRTPAGDWLDGWIVAAPAG